jgi:dolichyl-phosphooligosaccharide-protein glycotransferase
MGAMMGNSPVRWMLKSKYVILLLVLFGLALFLRVYPRLDEVFGSGWVRFGEVDPWYHIRLLENLLHHFPQQIAFDPYSYFPYGQPVQFAPGYDLILGFICWVIGLGSPSTHTVEVTAAYFPAILGALTVVPVYFIGKELFNKKVGLISAALIVFISGNFLSRSLLGVTDHHVAETLFSTTAALFLILAIKNARSRIEFADIRHGHWGKLGKPLIFALLCGLFLGLYVINWMGSLLFILILFVYFIIQIMIDHLTGQSTDYLGIISVPIFILALLITLPFLGRGGLSAMHPAALFFAAAASIILAALSGFLRTHNLQKMYFPLVIVGAIGAATGVFYAVAPSLFLRMFHYFDIFFLQSGSMTITEAQPLFFGFASITQNYAWGFFTTGLFVVPIALIFLIYATVKDLKAEKLFIITWSILMLAAMLGQNRFAYYFVVNAVILSGYLCWLIFSWISRGFKILGIKDRPPAGASSVSSKKKAQEKRKGQAGIVDRYFKPSYFSGALSVLTGFFLVFYPNISPALNITRLEIGPNNDWHDALVWLKDNSPEPFQDPAYFDRLYLTPSGKSFDYPSSAYGVMSAWDYGHWITTIAHRIPNSNPHQFGALSSAKFFTAQDESQANKILDQLGSRYVIIDVDMTTNMFLRNADWKDEKYSLYEDTYYQKTLSGSLQPLNIYYPEYYRSMTARLYNFLGRQVTPADSILTITYENRRDNNGNTYKLITDTKTFTSYDQAEAYCQKTANTHTVGTNPFSSPIPLEQMNHYELVYSSNSIVNQKDNQKNAYVEIFAYQP